MLTEVIDYAGLFPPASLSMADAVSRYARYRQGPHAWMLGRFIVPRARLEEFEQHAQPLLSEGAATQEPWHLSALASEDVAADRDGIAAFNARHRESGGRVVVDACEAKVASADDVDRIAAGLRDQLPGMLWLEAAPGAALPALLAAMARVRTSGTRVGAKLRTGGVTPEAIPAARSVAEFLLLCARQHVPCKMTAGLHHPVQAPHRLTYAEDSPTALMHGFVNVFLAATLARELVRRGRADADITPLIVALIGERDPHRLAWHDDHVAWRAHRLEIDAIAETRASFAISFGSCSFDEPIEDLEQLGWL